MTYGTSSTTAIDMYAFINENNLIDTYGDNLCDIFTEIHNTLSYYNDTDGDIEFCIIIENDVVYQCFHTELVENCVYCSIDHLCYCSSPMSVVNAVISAYNTLVPLGDNLVYIV